LKAALRAASLDGLSGWDWLEMARTRTHLLLEVEEFSEAAALAGEITSRCQRDFLIVFRSDAGLLEVLALLLSEKREEATSAASEVLRGLDPQVSSIRDTVEALLLVAGRSSADRYLEAVKRFPRRAHNDHYLFLATVASAEGRQEDAIGYLRRAQASTIGRNFPHFLIERLLRSK